MEGHLNDKDLQQYSIDQSALRHVALQHIASCKHCQIKAKQYAQIAFGLKHLPKMTVEIDWTALVLPVTKKKISWSTISIGALIFIGLLVIGIGAVLLSQDIRAVLLVGKNQHLYLLSSLALVLLVAGCAFYYREYKNRLNIIDLLN